MCCTAKRKANAPFFASRHKTRYLSSALPSPHQTRSPLRHTFQLDIRPSFPSQHFALSRGIFADSSDDPLRKMYASFCLHSPRPGAGHLTRRRSAGRFYFPHKSRDISPMLAGQSKYKRRTGYPATHFPAGTNPPPPPAPSASLPRTSSKPRK